MSEPFYTGGQCKIFYDVTVNYRACRIPSGCIEDIQTRTVIGPILGVIIDTITNPNGSGVVIVTATDQFGVKPVNGVFYYQIDGIEQAGSSPSNSFATIVSIVPSSGQPDNCGNIPAAPIQPIPQACAAGMPLSQ